MKKVLIIMLLAIAIFGVSNSSSNTNKTLSSNTLRAETSWAWVKNENGYRYQSGDSFKKGWAKIDSVWYLFNNNGYLHDHEGWETYKHRWIYSDGDEGYLTNTVTKLDSRVYKFDKNAYVKPIKSSASSAWGKPLNDMHITQGFHEGLAIDYQPRGCFLNPGCVSAKAVNNGTAHVNYHGSYGLQVIVDHGNGLCSRYAHLNSASVTNGQQVTKGTNIGRLGSSGNSTGVHLHFELRHGHGSNCMGSMVNPHSYNI